MTLLFCDVSGSTRLGERMDAESVRDLMSEYFREMRSVIESHGGTIEKFIGDAIVAVFGMPEAHEDDALRAVSAANDMAARLEALNERLQMRFGSRLEHRIGVNTGEVMVGGPIGGDTFATGDTVNVAARLEQAASPGDILIGESTYRSVKGAVRVDPVGPIAAKGKRLPIHAHRLVSIDRPVRAPHQSGGFVGREVEMADLRQTYRACVDQPRSGLVLLVGEPGVGKSRLVDVFGAEIAAEASVYMGRCLSYGAAITYWPLSEVVRQAAQVREISSREQARARLERTVASVEHGPRIATLLARAIGLEDGVASAEEIRWAAGRFVEAIARRGPLLLIFDDLQWAEPPLIDLIEHVAASAQTAPILIVGLARPELLEVRPKLGDAVIRLEPLDVEMSSLLLERLLESSHVPATARSRLLASAGGNPLFLEELVGAVADEEARRTDQGESLPSADAAVVPMPSSIQSLLEARLDGLPEDERRALEHASVEGEVFHRGAVEHLSGQTAPENVSVVLGRLVRKGFLRPAASTFADQAAFRFRHILIRDAAYGTTPKKVRAKLHEGLVDWAESVVGDRQPEFEEILGFHLEQAYLQRKALGTIDAHGFELADRAAGKLSSAGRRNFARGNVPAASNLFARAADLIPQAADRVPILVDLAEVLARGGDVAGSTRISAEVVRLADAAGDHASRSYAMLSYILTAVFPFVHHWLPHDEALAEIRSAIDVFEGTGDERGLARAYAALDVVDQTSGRGNQMRSALEASLKHARRADSEREEVWALGRLCITSVWDATPVDEAAERCVEVLSDAADRPLTRAQAQMSLAGLVAMGGDIEGGRERLAVVHDIHRELGSPMQAISHTAPMAAYIAFWAGDFETAERAVRPAFEAVERFGAPSTSRWMAALLADALCGIGDLEGAELVSRRAFEGVPADHRQAQIDWRIPRSRILARVGREEEGERLAQEAVAIAGETDFLLHKTMSLVALTDVLILREMWSEAEAALADAFKVCDRKRAPGLAAYAASREPLLRDRSSSP